MQGGQLEGPVIDRPRSAGDMTARDGEVASVRIHLDMHGEGRLFPPAQQRQATPSEYMDARPGWGQLGVSVPLRNNALSFGIYGP
jgi:hypothetical protein